jgi:hypothetical protein
MFKWIKRLVDSYEKMLGNTPPIKKPTIYKVGNKRYIRTKRISKKNIGKVRYIK